MSVSPPTPTPQAAAQAAPSDALAGAPAPNLWRRMACWLYEGMLMFGVVFIAGARGRTALGVVHVRATGDQNDGGGSAEKLNVCAHVRAP